MCVDPKQIILGLEVESCLCKSMVRIVKEKGKSFYQCGECGFKYDSKEWAEKCEAWCKANHTCNIEIISHAVSDK